MREKPVHRATSVARSCLLALLVILSLGCGGVTTTEETAENRSPSSTGSTGSTGSTEGQQQDWAVSGSAGHRIGPGRAVAAAVGGNTTLVATTTGIEVRRGGQVFPLPVPNLDPPNEVRISPDGRTGLVQRLEETEVWRLDDSPQLVTSWPLGQSSALSADGSAVLASPTVLGIVAPSDGGVEKVAAPGGRSFGPVAAAADGSWWFASLSGGERLQALQSTGGDEPQQVSLEVAGHLIVEQLTPDPSGGRVAIGLLDESEGFTRQIVMWDVETEAARWSVPLLADDVWDVGPDGSILIVGTASGRLIGPGGDITELGAIHEGLPPFTIHGLASGRFVVLLRDGGRIIVGSDGQVTSRSPGTGGSVTSSITATDRSGAAIVYFLGQVEILGESGDLAEAIDGYAIGVVNDVAIFRDESVAVATSTGTVALVALDEPVPGAAIELTHDQGDVQSVAFSPDGTRLVTGLGERFSENTYDDTVTIWDVSSRERLVEIGGEGEEVLGCSSFTNVVRYSPDGSFFIGVSHDFTVSVFDSRSFELVRTLPPHSGPVLGVAVSPDNTMVVTTSQEDLTFRVWDITSGDLVAEHQTALGGFRSVSFLPDGAGLLVSELSGQLSIVDPDSGETTLTFESNMSIGGSPTASPDGRFVAAGDGSVTRLWSTETGAVVGELYGHSGFVTSTAFTGDGARLVTGATDGTAVVWDLTYR